MNTGQRIAKNTRILTFTNVTNNLLLFVFTIYIARYLGSSEFGKFMFAVAFSTISFRLTELGLNILTTREVARDKTLATKYLSNTFSIRFVSSIITLLLVFLIVDLLNYSYDTKLAIYVISLSLAIESFVQLFLSTFRAFEQMEYQAIVIITGQLIRVSLGLYLLFSGYGLVELVFVFLVSSFFKFVLGLSIMLKKFAVFKPEIDLEFCKDILRKSYPLAFASLFVMIYFRIDTVMLSIMKGNAVVGWYNAAYTIIIGFGIIPSSLLPVLFPVMSQFFKDSKNSLQTVYEKAFKYLLLTGLLICIVTTLLANNIISLLYGNEYGNSVIALRILVWGQLFVFLNNLTGVMINAINEQKINMKIVGIGAFLNIILNLLLIPSLNYIGASIATVITEGAVLLASYIFLSKRSYKLSWANLMVSKEDYGLFKRLIKKG